MPPLSPVPLLSLKNLSLSLLMTTFASVSLWANQPTPAEQTTTSEQPISQSHARDAGTTMIYGERTPRSLLATYSSVTTYDADTLFDRNINSLGQAVERTPGILSVGPRNGYAIRGITTESVGGGDNRFGPTIAVELDGVKQSRLAVRYNPFDLWDMDRVEILRGSQSTQRGSDALAGAIVLKSNDPTFQQSGAFELGLMTENGYSTSLMFNQPFNDRWAIRFAMRQDQSDGYINNTTLQDDADPSKNRSLRMKTLYQLPDESLRVLTTIQYRDIDLGNAFTNRANPFNQTITSNLFGTKNNQNLAISQDIDYQIDHQTDLHVRLAYGNDHGARLDDDDFTAAGLNAYKFRHESTKHYTLESRLSYEDADQSAHVGLYLTRTEIDETFGSNDLNLALLGFPLPPNTPLLDLTTRIDAAQNHYALFGEYQIQLADHLSARAGLRVDYSDITMQASQSSTVPFIIPPGQDKGQRGFLAIQPTASLTYHLTDKHNLTALYKQGYRAGAAEWDVQLGKVNAFDPEQTHTVELAHRIAELADQIAIETNVYYTYWQDQQVGVGTGILKVTRNAGSSRLWGAETSITWTPDDHFTLYTSAAYNRTRFIKFTDSGNNYAGNRFPHAPIFSGSFGIHYQINGYFADVNLNYQGASFTDASNNHGYQNDARAVTNLTFGYEQPSYYVKLFATNLLDVDYIDRHAAPPFPVHIGTPQQFGLKIGYRF